MLPHNQKKVNKLICIYSFYEWYPFVETIEGYEVIGKLMAEPCLITTNPVIHDIEIVSVIETETGEDLTKTVDHGYLLDRLERLIF